MNLRKSTAVIAIAFALKAYGGFTPHLVDGGTDSPSFLFPWDMNGDEAMDLLATAWDDSAVLLFTNLSGSWEKSTICSDFQGATSVCAGDINGDGTLDIAGTAWDSAELRCWYGNGSGGYEEQIIASNLPAAHEVSACDVNGDGYTDLVTAVAGLNRISVWFNDGGAVPSWNEQRLSSTMVGARSVCCADFDGNGTVDIAGAAFTSGSVRWWANDGGQLPSWTENSLTEGWNGAHMVRSGDLDGDGLPDVAAVSYYAGGIRLWLSGESFQQFTVTSAFDGALGIAVADLDCDGAPDITATSETSNTLKWWRNTGFSGQWTGETVDGALQGAWPVCAADLDDDGLTDLAAGASFVNVVRWYENQGTAGIEHSGETLDMTAAPNPSSGVIRVTARGLEEGPALITVYDMEGRRVLSMQATGSGNGTFQLDTSPLGCGVYSIRVSCGNSSAYGNVAVLP